MEKSTRYRNRQNRNIDLLNQQLSSLQTGNKKKTKIKLEDLIDDKEDEYSEFYFPESEDEHVKKEKSTKQYRETPKKRKSKEYFEDIVEDREEEHFDESLPWDDEEESFEKQSSVTQDKQVSKKKKGKVFSEDLVKCEAKEIGINPLDDDVPQIGEVKPMEQHEHICIPDELKDFLFVEDCSKFDVETYMPTKVQEDILQSIVTARKIATAMKEKNGLSYPNTTLLYGPPGTGKTTLGRYVAYRMGMDFVYLDFSKIIDGIFGSTSRNISNIFQYMIDKECIFMLDELDAVAVKRGNESEATGGELSRITITIMQQFDYYRRHDSQAIIIAATNRADRIDAALRSRFSIEHEIKEMTVQEKVEYIRRFLTRHEIPFSEENIRDYSSRNSLLPTRNVESDIIRCLVEFYKHDGKQAYVLNHIAKGREF